MVTCSYVLIVQCSKKYGKPFLLAHEADLPRSNIWRIMSPLYKQVEGILMCYEFLLCLKDLFNLSYRMCVIPYEIIVPVTLAATIDKGYIYCILACSSKLAQ